MSPLVEQSYESTAGIQRVIAFFLDTAFMILIMFMFLGIVILFESPPLGYEPLNDHIISEATGTNVLLGPVGVILIYLIYHTYYVGNYVATLGKKLMGLVIVHASARPISYILAFGRCVVVAAFLIAMAMLSEPFGIFLFIGYYCIALFDKEKRTLHDMVCGTRVIKV